MGHPIYLDYQATTPIDPQVLNAMLPWLHDNHANPHSTHKSGRAAAAVIEWARDHVAALMPADGQVIFTSGATEAINLAVHSCVKRSGAFIASQIEHAAVLDAMTGHGIDKPQVRLPVTVEGQVDQQAASDILPSQCALMATMLVNNEIGTVQPVSTLADMAHHMGGLFLCDAVQGFGRLDIPENVDFVAVSAHKIHGPKGIGALWVRHGIDLDPILFGGGQEQSVRSGTLSPALCVGLGQAAKIARERQSVDSEHVGKLFQLARTLFSDWTINGSITDRYLGNLNIRREGLDSSRLLSEVRDVAFSAGSACASGSGRPSHVLKSIGLDRAELASSIRLGFGRFTTEDNMIEAAHLINIAAT